MKRQLFSLGLTVAVFASIVLGAETTKKITTTDADASMVGEQIKWQVIGGGGTDASSVGYKLRGTVVQTATTSVTSVGYKTSQGFWYSGLGFCCVIDGNVNHVGNINVADVTYLVKYLFQGGPLPPCLDEANTNDLGGINVADVTYLVKYLFQGGPPPPGGCP
jgi:hypothetical protein